MKKLRELFEKEDDFGLRNLSNIYAEEAAKTSNKRLAYVSILAYALSKMLQKPHIVRSDLWPEIKEKILQRLQGKEEKMLEDIEQIIKNVDEQLGNFVMNLVEKARIKQASRMYALGLSLSKAVELTGAEKGEVVRYIGMTKIHERPYTKTLSAKKRYERIKKVLLE